MFFALENSEYMLIVNIRLQYFPSDTSPVDGPGHQIPKHPVVITGSHKINCGCIDDQNRKIILL